MELSINQRQTMDEEIENWDDDDLEIGGDAFAFQSRTASIATTNALSHHRDSISSRLSLRSDFESNHGDEERQVHLPADDERSTNDAIAAATRAGIPLPQNVPSSALMGGTIKRLGGRKIKKIIQQDDWDDDLEFPEIDEGLKIKDQDATKFPDALRQVSGPGSIQPSPAKALQPSPILSSRSQPDLSKALSQKLNLDRFRDDDDDDFLGDATIKVPKNRQTKPVTVILPPTPMKPDVVDDDDFEKDLQLPSDGEPLKLSSRKDIPKTPVSAQDEFDEWGEGSLGTRFGGTRREGRSNRSSSVSALSPSVASSLTAESEDEGLDGLVLPTGPLNFDDILKKRQESQSPERLSAEKQAANRAAVKEDFFTGLEIGDGDVFDSNKLTLNRNIKVKAARQTSPQRPKTAVTLTFTNKPSVTTNSRLPRPSGGHDRHPSSLEPVSESGDPIAKSSRRSQSRIGHSAQSSVSSLPPPTPTSLLSQPPSTPRRHDLNQRTSTTALRNEPTTTSAQLLKLKRSMPIMRSPAKPMQSRYERPPSRADSGSRPPVSRPKTPVERDRSGAESSLSHARRNPMPFLPAGASQGQSHHIIAKASRHFRRNDSESSNNSLELRPSSRAVSRSTMRSPSPSRSRLRGAEALAQEAAMKRQVTKPRRARHFGDGFELDGFDDLPTSYQQEQRFTKQPVARGAPKSLLRNKIIQSNLPERTTTPLPPTPTTPFTPGRSDNLPRFARDTNSSRIAREQVLAQRAPSNGAPLTALTNQWKAQISAKTGLTSITGSSTTRSRKKPVQQKPHLIKPLGDVGRTVKSIKGMIYNPVTFRWEGNENDLSPFDIPSNSPSVASMPPSLFREKENTTPRPALITNINGSQGVQVVGGMVFDPQRMCWLKVPTQRDQSRGRKSTSGDTLDGFDAFDDDDEEDVFKDVPDLDDKPASSSPTRDQLTPGLPIGGSGTGDGSSRKSVDNNEWLVGEEFDVGPEFVRRQREEEGRWKRKVQQWLGPERDVLDAEEDWRWRIRWVVNEL